MLGGSPADSRANPQSTACDEGSEPSRSNGIRVDESWKKGCSSGPGIIYAGLAGQTGQGVEIIACVVV